MTHCVIRYHCTRSLENKSPACVVSVYHNLNVNAIIVYVVYLVNKMFS